MSFSESTKKWLAGDEERRQKYLRQRRNFWDWFITAGIVLVVAILTLLLSIPAKAQTLKLFKAAAWGETKYGYYYRPALPGKYPVVIFFHGSGEVGTDSNSAKSLLNLGPLAFIKSGWRPDLVIFAIQVPYWSPAPDLCKYILENDQDINPYWDGSKILWTGLSAGGQRVLEAMALKYPGSFVPMSPAGIPFSRIDLSIPYRIWDFHGDRDKVCPYSYSKDLVDLLNTTFPGSAKLTTYPSGHDSWQTFYNPLYKNPVSIYEFGAAGGPPPKIPLITIKIYTDGSTETIKH